MSSASAKVLTINEFLAMTTVDILKLQVDHCQLGEFYKGILGQTNDPLNKQLLALRYFLAEFKCSIKREELFQILFPKLKETLSELWQSATVDDMNSYISTVIPSIHDIFDLTIGDSIPVLQNLVVGVLDLLLQLYELIQERGQCDDLWQLENSIQNLDVLRSKLFSNLMSINVTYLPVKLTISDVKFCNKIISILCEMAEFACAKAPKLSVEVWKCITKLCTNNSVKSMDQLVTECVELNCMEYLLCAVKTGCCCIQNNIQEICESSDERTSKGHSKAIAFVTSILQRLASTYPHDKFRGHDHVLTTLLILIKTIRTIPQHIDFLNQNLVFGLQNVLFLICKSNKFPESFYRASCDEFSMELLNLGLEISTKILDEDDSELLQYFMNKEEENIVCKMLNCLAIGPVVVFRKKQMYTDLVAKLFSILIKSSTFRSNIVVRLLVKNLLQSNNITMGYMVIDLWTIWLRYLSEAQCFDLILFWSRINEQFSIIQPIHMQSIHVKILLQNLYDSLSDSYQLQLLLNKPVRSNIKLWATLGLNRIKDETKEIIDLEMDIEMAYKLFVAERTDSTFYKLIEYLRLSETMSQTTDGRVPDYLINIWKMNFIQQSNKYSSLIIPIIRISVVYKRTLNNSQHFQILRTLNAIAGTPNLKIHLKLEILNYLSHIAIKHFTVEYQKDILNSIRQLFRKSFNDSDAIVKQVAFSVYAQVMVDAQHDDITPDNITDDVTVQMELYNFIAKKSTFMKDQNQQMKFLTELSSYSMQHECRGAQHSASDGLQRNNLTENRIKEIIDRIQLDVKELAKLNRTNKLTDEFRESIVGIREELAVIK